MRLSRNGIIMLLPATVLFLALLGGPIITLIEESFRLFVPGRVGSTEGAPFTLKNYTELIEFAYIRFFWLTVRVSFIAAVFATALGFTIDYSVSRIKSEVARKLWIGFLVTMMFISILVRVYSLELTFGPVGLMKWLPGVLGFRRSSAAMIEIVVVAGLLHFTLPMAALTLVGTVQNVNPRLAEAAQTLGASRWLAHLTVTIPMCARGLLSAFLISFTLSVSAFIVPLILGKGRVVFVSNLIYSRFSEIANYPSGAALSLVLLVFSFAIVYAITEFVSRRLEYN